MVRPLWFEKPYLPDLALVRPMASFNILSVVFDGPVFYVFVCVRLMAFYSVFFFVCAIPLPMLLKLHNAIIEIQTVY